MGMAEGWYRDPVAPDPARPSTLRFWDGNQWTMQVKAASRAQRSAWREEIAVEQHAAARQRAEQAALGGGHALATEMLVEDVWGRQATPDGQLLAGWWARAAASIVDSLLSGALVALFGWRFLSRFFDAMTAVGLQADQASRTGMPMPADGRLVTALIGPFLGLLAVSWAVTFAYGVGFLKAFQATPGKMLLGLEVRLRERPGPLSWGTVLLRWFGEYGIGMLQIVPLLGIVVFAYIVLDRLWPVWDGGRQALHDKVARTNVVRR